MIGLEYLLAATFPAFIILAAASDLATMTISNRLTLALVAAFPLVAFFSGLPLSSAGWQVLTAFLVLTIGIAGFALGAVGGGDAKLAAAMALWIDPSLVFLWLLIMSAFGGVLTVTILILRRFHLPVAFAGQSWIARLHSRDSGIPYGVALAAAGLVIYPDTAIFNRLLGL